MTLGNMRANGVRSLLAYCFTCHHEAVLGVEDYPDDVSVPAFAPRMVCKSVSECVLLRELPLDLGPAVKAVRQLGEPGEINRLRRI
jgi:hypothetical protein